VCFSYYYYLQRPASSGGGNKWRLISHLKPDFSIVPLLPPGVYLAGTGSTGVGMTLCALGLTYFGITFSSALIYRLPPDDHAQYVMAGKAAGQDKAAKPPPVGQGGSAINGS
jgi:hypothetical protein